LAEKSTTFLLFTGHWSDISRKMLDGVGRRKRRTCGCRRSFSNSGMACCLDLATGGGIRCGSVESRCRTVCSGRGRSWRPRTESAPHRITGIGFAGGPARPARAYSMGRRVISL
jgi:hypothetical protein